MNSVSNGRCDVTNRNRLCITRYFKRSMRSGIREGIQRGYLATEMVTPNGAASVFARRLRHGPAIGVAVEHGLGVSEPVLADTSANARDTFHLCSTVCGIVESRMSKKAAVDLAMEYVYRSWMETASEACLDIDSVDIGDTVDIVNARAASASATASATAFASAVIASAATAPASDIFAERHDAASVVDLLTHCSMHGNALFRHQPVAWNDEFCIVAAVSREVIFVISERTRIALFARAVL